MIKINGYVDDISLMKDLLSKVDYFISGISHEDRGMHCYNFLESSGIKIDRKVLFYFQDVIDERINSEASFDALFGFDEKKDLKISTGLYAEGEGYLKIKEYFKYEDISLESKIVVFDFSVLVKPYLFLLVYFLFQEAKALRIYFVYTEPFSYFNEEPEKAVSGKEVYFTRGTTKTAPIPYYFGREKTLLDKALFILLGFEGNRANEVITEIDPQFTIPVNGFPSFKPSYKDKSLLANEEILKEPEIFNNLKFSAAYDPFETMRLLDDLYEAYNSRYNVSIAPLGSKPMALGACFSALKYRSVRIIFPYPTDYNLKTSSGSGKSWLYIAERA